MVNPIELTEVELKKKEINESRLSEIVLEFKKNGFIVLKNIFKKELISSLNKIYQTKYSEYLQEKLHPKATQFVNKRFIVTIDIDSDFNTPDLYFNPILFSIFKKLFLDKIIISDFHCVTALPGAEAMPIHKDGVVFEGNPLSPLLPPHAIGLLIPLIPFSTENGATQFWAGSHLNISKVESDYEKDTSYYTAELDIGSCILMDYRLVHKANANISNEIRPLLYINYTAYWYFDFKTFINQTPLKIDDNNFEKVPQDAKFLFARRNIYK